MPVQRVINKGKVGYRFGQSGHVYYGAGAEAKARLQERAARAAGWKEPATLGKR